VKKKQSIIIINSQGLYAGSYGTASFLDYVKAVKEGHIIHNKKYKDMVSNLIKNNNVE